MGEEDKGREGDEKGVGLSLKEWRRMNGRSERNSGLLSINEYRKIKGDR